jgi:translation initiation factor IF-2
VKVGLECGIGIDGFDDLQVDDTLAFFKEVKIKRTLKDVES